MTMDDLRTPIYFTKAAKAAGVAKPLKETPLVASDGSWLRLPH